nr:hypothetical protein [Pandoravirus massiliensis]
MDCPPSVRQSEPTQIMGRVDSREDNTFSFSGPTTRKSMLFWLAMGGFLARGAACFRSPAPSWPFLSEPRRARLRKPTNTQTLTYGQRGDKSLSKGLHFVLCFGRSCWCPMRCAPG